jgi:hypothetical protein
MKTTASKIKPSAQLSNVSSDCQWSTTRLRIPEKLRSEFLFHTWFQSFFGLECSDWGFAAPAVLHWHTFTHRPIWMPPPLRSRPNTFREGLSLVLSLHTSKRSRYWGSLSWVAFKLKKKWPKPRPLRRNFWPHSGSDWILTHEQPQPRPEFAT